MEKLKLAKQAFKPKESEIEASILRYLGFKNIYAWRSHAGQMIPAMTGISDIIGIFPNGRMIAIEVKLPGWRPPLEETKQYKHYAKQRDFIRNIRQSNGIAFFATSVAEVESQLEITREIERGKI